MEYPAAHTEAGSLAAGPGPINAIKQLKHTAKKISTSLSKRVVVLAPVFCGRHELLRQAQEWPC